MSVTHQSFYFRMSCPAGSTWRSCVSSHANWWAATLTHGVQTTLTNLSCSELYRGKLIGWGSQFIQKHLLNAANDIARCRHGHLQSPHYVSSLDHVTVSSPRPRQLVALKPSNRESIGVDSSSFDTQSTIVVLPDQIQLETLMFVLLELLCGTLQYELNFELGVGFETGFATTGGTWYIRFCPKL
ncbi:hypothetical protein K470DRAFT_31123 [Piedraia hortae CBS 480.64]|uniref:Uncharacterized protein n=1 Tax=Piedraia hortae CBS 480.64 TaxID=1314780 RepID=A0A6A7C4C7_9PEZI|nr:hypothetical protein K470DRAFT_31123 [Piedraia hortae CBS 480.64]